MTSQTAAVELVTENTAASEPKTAPAAGRARPIIECRELTKVYRKGETEVVALREFTHQIPDGSLTALMGPSGSGKSTLLNLIAGLDTPTSGSLVAAGVEVPSLSQKARSRWRAGNVGFVFQSFNLVPVLTAFDNVNLPLALKKLSRGERRARVRIALEIVGLEDRADHYPHQLSQGQEQRVAIARAIVADPPLLLADEPTGNLDAASARSVVQLFATLHQEFAKTVILVTHDPVVAEMAQIVHRLDKGRLMETTVAGRV